MRRLETRPQPTEPRWYAVAVSSRQEKAAASGLADRGFEVFIPTRPERRLWSDRIKTLERVLFPGYLFLRASLDARARASISKVRQVRELVGRLPGRRMAEPVPDLEVESLRAAVGAAREVDPVVGLTRGADVIVGQGPLRGARGVVVEEPDGRRRLVIQIPLLGRGVRVTLEADDVLDQ